MSSPRDLELSKSFRHWRRITRAYMLMGPVLIFLGWRIGDPKGRQFLIMLGASLLVSVFPMYFRKCTRCPRCQRSFSKPSGYAAVDSEDTSGLPLFNKIVKCPFCELTLDSSRNYR